MKKIIVILCVLFINLTSYSFSIHVFGDSHASACFSNTQTGLIATETSDFFYKKNLLSLTIPFTITNLTPRTMFRVGRDGINGLSVKDYGVQDGDVVVFLFGEVDVRCHIGKQRDVYGRELNVIIDELAQSYIKTMIENRQRFSSLRMVIVSVIPPSDQHYNPQFPSYGTLQDRVAITRHLNRVLQFYAFKNDILFLDIYSYFAQHDGSLNVMLSDGTVHIHQLHNKIIREKLIELIYSIK